CVQPRAGTLWPLALPMIPYMRANLAAKREGLARADAVIAVSHRIARDLVQRAPELSRTRVDVIPNAVNIEALHLSAGALTKADLSAAALTKTDLSAGALTKAD